MMLSEIVSKWNPWPALKEGSVSMLSDGKISIKRVLSLMAFVLVAHLVVRVLVATKELPNKDMILHMEKKLESINFIQVQQMENIFVKTLILINM